MLTAAAAPLLSAPLAAADLHQQLHIKSNEPGAERWQEEGGFKWAGEGGGCKGAEGLRGERWREELG